MDSLPGWENPDCVHKSNFPFSGNPGRSRSPGLCVCRAERSWAQGCAPPPGQALLCEPHSPSPLAPAHGVTCLAPSSLVSSPAPSPPLAQPHGYLQPPPPTGDPLPSPGPLRACAHAFPPHGTPLCLYGLCVLQTQPSSHLQEPPLTRELGWCLLPAPRTPVLDRAHSRACDPLVPSTPSREGLAHGKHFLNSVPISQVMKRRLRRVTCLLLL